MADSEAILADGAHVPAHVAVRGDWSMDALVDGVALHLLLQAVVPSGGASLFLFAPAEPQARYAPHLAAGPLPPSAAELLLYAPTVALKKCDEGFRLLSWPLWRELTTAPSRDCGAVSSLVESCAVTADEERKSESESESLGALSLVGREEEEDLEEDLEEDDADL